MNTIIAQKQRYLPHTLETKYHAVKTYRSGCSIRFVCRKYKISKASLMRWNKKFDGDKASLVDKSHRPHSKHPKAHTDDEIRHIKNYIRRNPNISMIELYAKLKKNKSYKRHPCSLFRLLRKMGFFKNEKKKEKKYVPKKYHTPDNIGEKWQLDVKYVPQRCKEMMEKKPEEVMAHAVSGMLPKNKLRDRMMTRLRVYRGAEHPHAAQNPQVLNV